MKEQGMNARPAGVGRVLAMAIVLAVAGPAASFAGEWFSDGKIVVANRAGKSISVIDVATDRARTYPLPDNAEPMYVVYSPPRGECEIDQRRGRSRVFVGD